MSVNATQVPQNADVPLFTLIGTWALVAVALVTVVVTAWQNRNSQKLQAQQTRVMAKQMEMTIAQTTLQQEQFAEMLKEQERPRVRELILKVLTTAIQLIENNNQARTQHYLVEESILHNYLVGSSDPATRLAFDGFKGNYPELPPKSKHTTSFP